MNFEEVMDAARGNMGPYCKVCPVCDGRACKNQMPGPGAKGVGDNAVAVCWISVRQLQRCWKIS